MRWRMKDGYKKLGAYIRQVDERNKNLSVNRLLGVSNMKVFISSIANTIGTDLSSYKIVHTRQFAFPQMIEELFDWYRRKQIPLYDEKI